MCVYSVFILSYNNPFTLFFYQIMVFYIFLYANATNMNLESLVTLMILLIKYSSLKMPIKKL